MRFLKIFAIISLIIITIYIAAARPELHKQFILETPNFKLSGINQLPQDFQSSILFKIGDSKKSNSTSSKTVLSDNTEQISSEIQIIPSAFISSTVSEYTDSKGRTGSSTNYDVTTSQGTQNNERLNSDAMLAQVAKMLKNGATGSNSGNISGAPDSKKNRTEEPKFGNNINCPECGSLRDVKYKNELIAWNEWRSRIQNRIMDDSDVDAGYGTIFYFLFKVDKERNISDIKVICTDFSNSAARTAVRNAINNLRGNPILEFPAGTNRKKVDFNGGFIIGSYSEYATPGDYNDFEQIRLRY